MCVDPVLDNVGLVGEALPLLDVLKCTFMQAARRLANVDPLSFWATSGCLPFGWVSGLHILHFDS